MAVSKDLTLGTKFDADITDFQAKLEKVRKELMGLVATSSQLTKAISTSSAAIGNLTGRSAGFDTALKKLNDQYKATPAILNEQTKSLVKLDNSWIKHLKNTGLAPEVIKRAYDATNVWNLREAELVKSIKATSTGIDHLWKSTDNSTAATNKAISVTNKSASSTQNLAAQTNLASKDYTVFGEILAKNVGRGAQFEKALVKLNTQFKDSPAFLKAEAKELVKTDEAFMKHLRNTGLAPDVIKRVRNATNLWRIRQAELDGQLVKSAAGLKHVWKSTDNSTAAANKAALSTQNLAAQTNLASKDYTAFGEILAKNVGRGAQFEKALVKLNTQFKDSPAFLKAEAKELVKTDEAFMKHLRNTGLAPEKIQKVRDATDLWRIRQAELDGQLVKSSKGLQHIWKTTDNSTAATNKAASSVQNLAKATKLASKDYTDFGQVTEKTSGRAKRFHADLGRVRDMFGSTGPVFKAAAKNLVAVDDALIRNLASSGKASAVIDKQYKSFNRFAALEKANIRTKGSLNTRINDVVSSTLSANKATDKGTTAYKGFNKQLSHVHGGLAKVKSAMQVTAAYGVSSAVLFTLVNGLKAGYDEIVKFDQGLKNVQAVTRATDAELSVMRDTMLGVARSTKFSAGEITDGMTLIGQAGFDAGESVKILEAIANLATGTIATMAESSDLVTTAIRAFSLSALEAGHVTDIMTNAINGSKLTLNGIRTVFNYVGAAAAEAGLSINDLQASTMILADAGMKMSTIGTGLRQVLARMLSPGKKLRESIEGSGLAIKDLNPELVGYRKSLETLSSVLLDADGKTIRMSKAIQMFGLRGAQAAAVVVKGFLDGRFDSAIEKLDEIGSAEKAAGIQAEGLELKLKNLWDRSKALAVTLGDQGLVSAFKILIDVGRALATGLEYLSGSVLGGFIFSVVSTTAVLTGLTAAMRLFGVVMTGTVAGARIVAALQDISYGFTRLRENVALSTVAATNFRNAMNLLGGPAIWVTGIIAGTVVMLKKFINRNLELSKAALKASIELKGQSDALAYFSNKLEETGGTGKEYENVIKRLEKEHPKLADELSNLAGTVDVASIAYSKLVELMKEQAKIKADEAIEKHRQAILDVQAAHSGFTQGLREAWSGLLYFYESMDTQNKRLYESYKNDLSPAVKAYNKDLKDQVVAGKLSKEAAIQLIKEFGLLPEVEAKAIKVLSNSIETSNIVIKNTKAAVATMSSEYKGFYDKLDSYRQTNFLAEVQSFEEGNVAFKAELEKKGIAGEEANRLAEIRQDVFYSKMYQKYVDDSDEQIAQDRRAADDKLRLLDKALIDESITIDAANKDKLAVETDHAEKVYLIRKAQYEKINTADVEGKKAAYNQVMAAYGTYLDKDLAEYRAYAKKKQRLMDSEIAEYKGDLDHKLKMIELSVERGVISEESGIAQKRALEIEYLEFIIEIRSKAVTESAAKYGTDTDNYRDAVEAKKAAERDLQAFKDDALLEDVKRTKSANAEIQSSDNETTENAVDNVEKVEKAVKRSSIKIQDAISVSLDGIESAYEAIVDAAEESADSEISALERVTDATKVAVTIRQDAYMSLANEAASSAATWIGAYEKAKSATGRFARNLVSQAASQVSIYTELAQRYYSVAQNTGYSAGGSIPGHGGGDTVSAKLEPGEYVEPVATVDKYGTGLFEALRKRLIPTSAVSALMRGVQSMHNGGTVKDRVRAIGVPVRMSGGGSVSGQQDEKTHVLKFMIGGQTRTLSGTENNVTGLIRDLKRQQLVRA